MRRHVFDFNAAVMQLEESTRARGASINLFTTSAGQSDAKKEELAKNLKT